MRIFQNANFEFIARRKTAYVISIALVVASLIGALFWQVQRDSWLNYGVDFRGGTLVQVRFTEPTSAGELRAVVDERLGRPEVTAFGGENEYLIRAPEFTAEGENVSDAIVQILTERFGAGAFTVVRTEAVGAKVGSELQRKAIIAIALSFLLTLIYLAFRFEWRFGVAALVATIHDALVTVGMISLLQLEVSLTTVAAVLTIIGYSLNDTIVIFDRVRENVKKIGRREEHTTLLNRSINETLPRTTLTAGGTLAALLSLMLLGGPIIFDFAVIMFFGIVLGTYSSIFVATPVLLEIQKRWGAAPRKAESRRSGRPAPPARSGV